MNKLDRHEKVCMELYHLYKSKNHDYGDSFGETYRKLGIISAVTRLTDKINRLQTICTKKQEVSNESIRDTLIDTANYAIMTIMAMDERLEITNPDDVTDFKDKKIEPWDVWKFVQD